MFASFAIKSNEGLQSGDVFQQKIRLDATSHLNELMPVNARPDIHDSFSFEIENNFRKSMLSRMRGLGNKFSLDGKLSSY